MEVAWLDISTVQAIEITITLVEKGEGDVQSSGAYGWRVHGHGLEAFSVASLVTSAAVCFGGYDIMTCSLAGLSGRTSGTGMGLGSGISGSSHTTDKLGVARATWASGLGDADASLAERGALVALTLQVTMTKNASSTTRLESQDAQSGLLEVSNKSGSGLTAISHDSTCGLLVRRPCYPMVVPWRCGTRPHVIISFVCCIGVPKCLYQPCA